MHSKALAAKKHSNRGCRRSFCRAAFLIRDCNDIHGYSNTILLALCHDLFVGIAVILAFGDIGNAIVGPFWFAIATILIRSIWQTYHQPFRHCGKGRRFWHSGFPAGWHFRNAHLSGFARQQGLQGGLPCDSELKQERTCIEAESVVNAGRNGAAFQCIGAVLFV